MGIWDDVNRLKQQSDEVAAASGRPTRMTDRIAALPGDLAKSADMAAYAAALTSRPTTDVSQWWGATARLDRFRATGALMGMDPVAEVDLDVTIEGQDPYRVTTQIVVPYAAAGLHDRGPGAQRRGRPGRPDPDRAHGCGDLIHAAPPALDRRLWIAGAGSTALDRRR